MLLLVVVAGTVTGTRAGGGGLAAPAMEVTVVLVEIDDVVFMGLVDKFSVAVTLEEPLAILESKVVVEFEFEVVLATTGFI